MRGRRGCRAGGKCLFETFPFTPAMHIARICAAPPHVGTSGQQVQQGRVSALSDACTSWMRSRGVHVLFYRAAAADSMHHAHLMCSVRNYQQALSTLRSITGVSKQKHARASAEVARLTSELREVNTNLQSVFTQLRCARVVLRIRSELVTAACVSHLRFWGCTLHVVLGFASCACCAKDC